jgi:nesprin-1
MTREKEGHMLKVFFLAYFRLTELRAQLQSLKRQCNIYILKLASDLGYDVARLDTIDEHSEALHPMSSLVSFAIKSIERLIKVDRWFYSVLQHRGEQSSAAAAAGLDSGEEINTTILQRSCRFLERVVRASLPIQAVMLLILGICAIIPNSDDCSCNLANNFARSLEPMLHYPNGQPPI